MSTYRVSGSTGLTDFSVATIEAIVLYRSNWEQAVEDAQERNALG